VDWKMAKIGFVVKQWPVVLGCDFSGVVEDVGADIQNFKKGDEVYGYSQLGAGRTGTFQERLVTPEIALAKKPSNISFEEAATLSVGTLTAAVALFWKFGLPTPAQNHTYEKPEYLLVWGGSSSVGTYAVQLGHLAGLTVITTASARNHENLKNLGATHVLDHSAPDIVDQIRKITHDDLRYAVDTISQATADLAVKSLSTTHPAHLATVAGKPETIPSNVTSHPVSIAGFTPEDLQWFKRIFGELTPYLEQKKYSPIQVQHVPKGLAGVPEAFRLSAEGKVSGKKLVVVIAETP